MHRHSSSATLTWQRPAVAGLTSLSALALFAAVAYGVSEQKFLARLDAPLAVELHEYARQAPAAVPALQGVTAIGSVEVLAGVSLVVSLTMILRRHYLPILAWWLVLLGGGLLDHALKTTFRRERPLFPDPLAPDRGFGFPSGHTLEAVVCYGLLVYYVTLAGPRRWVRVAVVVVAGLIVLAVGFSRLFLGVHFLTDVLGAYAAGTFWLAGCLGGIEAFRRKTSGRLTPADKSLRG
jgi:membrane-associated phospholipid phosphatase